MQILQRHCSNITIIDDNVPHEPDEQFVVTLSGVVPRGIFIRDTTFVTIIDDDCKLKYYHWHIMYISMVSV